MPTLTQITTTLQTLLTTQTEQLARQNGLVQRCSKLSAPLLVLIVITGFWQLPSASYNYLAQVALDLGVQVTRQGLQARLATPAARTFFEQLVRLASAQLQARTGLEPAWLEQFEAIYLHDSTHFNLSPRLKTTYPSGAAKGSPAALKLQVSWDWLHQHFAHLAEQPGAKSDLGYHLQPHYYKPNTLVIFDLGYFVLASLQKLSEAGVWWVSRLDLKCNLFEPTHSEPLDLLKLVSAGNQTQTYYDLPVLVGTTQKLKARLIVTRVPTAIAQERRRKANQLAKHRGWQSDQKHRDWQDYNAYLTNLPPERSTSSQVILLYRLRWQIELVFKLAKSQAQLAHLRVQRETSVLVAIYAKLLGLILFYYLTTPSRFKLDQAERKQELSLVKAWQTLSRHALKFGQVVLASELLEQFLAELHQRFEKFCFKEYRPNRLSSFAQLEQNQLQFQKRHSTLA